MGQLICKKTLLRVMALLLCAAFFCGAFPIAAANVEDFDWVIGPNYEISNYWPQFKQGLTTLQFGIGTATPTMLSKSGEIIPLKNAVGDNSIFTYELEQDSFNEGFSPFHSTQRSNGSFYVGFINQKGEIKYYSNTLELLNGFSEGLTRFTNISKAGSEPDSPDSGFMDTNGKIVIPAKYNYACNFSDGLARVGMSDEWNLGFINRAGEEVIPMKYDKTTEFSEGLAAVVIDKKWGYIDKTGKLVIEPKYERINDFHEERAFAMRDNCWYIIDYEGNEIPMKDMIIPDPRTPDDYVHYRFSEGVAVIEKNDEKDGYKYGTVNKNGEIVIPFIFDPLHDCNEGLHHGTLRDKNGKVWQDGFYDQFGNLVLETTRNTPDEVYSDGVYPSSEGVIRLFVRDNSVTNKNKSGYVRNPVTIASAWAEPEIDKAYYAGIVPMGIRALPKSDISRREFSELAVKTIEKIDGQSLTAAPVRSFSDTTDYSVRKLVALNIIDGISKTEFKPDGTITREQAAKIIANILDYAGVTPQELLEPNYPDEAEIADYAKTPVKIMFTSGLMKGTDTGFAPQQTLSKEQSIATMTRLLEYIDSQK